MKITKSSTLQGYNNIVKQNKYSMRKHMVSIRQHELLPSLENFLLHTYSNETSIYTIYSSPCYRREQ